MQRRQLLQLGLAGGGLVATGGWLAQAKAAKEHAAWQQFSAQEAFQLPITPNTTQLEITTAPVQVFGRRVMRGAIQQISGERGYSTTRQDGVDVVVTNRLAVPTTLHFHGLILPNAMDGVPFTTQPPIPPGERLRLRFPLQQDGTFWLHSHYGLQAQSFVAEPLLISTPEQDRWADHSFTVMLRDFSYTPAERILRNLVNGERGGGTAMARQLAGFPWHQPRPLRVQTWDEGAQRFRWEERSGVLMQPDVIFDALLANERTLDDPQVLDVEPGETVVVRWIAGSSFINFFLDLGELDAELLRTDANPVQPIRGSLFQLALAQRLSLRITMPEKPGFYPLLAYGDRSQQRCGVILRSGLKGATPTLSPMSELWNGELTSSQDLHLQASRPLAERAAEMTFPVSLNGPQPPYRWGLNQRFYPYRDPIQIEQGQRVELELINHTPMGHPMHLHGHEFQLVAINDQPIQGPIRDTVFVPKGERVRIALDADDPGIWAFHCHISDHHARGMFNVVSYRQADLRWWDPEATHHEQSGI
ncbi:multicopper oxidase family protein [Synechococcus sp. LA31]|uniref:multicopper oxidase family protein n=1 Tax=Synechococcus sp. LA31 TaxID=2741953 RepID=UPI001BDC91DE|nr:multicopper oxidase family protein [Synechococcus sp. LA31]QVV67423.1 multicopper oxidase family protein [Synechococcus sp. LA31]